MVISRDFYGNSSREVSPIIYCSFRRSHCSAGGRDLPVYTAGWTGAMRVKFLAQAHSLTQLAIEPCDHRTDAARTTKPLLPLI